MDLHQFVQYVCGADCNQKRMEEKRRQTEKKTKTVGLNNAKYGILYITWT